MNLFKILDLTLLSLTCCSREEGLLSVFQTVVPNVGEDQLRNRFLL